MKQSPQPSPFFSVVIAAFNSARWIVPTVRSALGQIYRDFEVIVIGDGCTDRTGEIPESSFGDAVRWKNLERNYGGQSFPNNEGIRLSRGTHIAYLGHDDIWSPHHLERLAARSRSLASGMPLEPTSFRSSRSPDPSMMDSCFAFDCLTACVCATILGDAAPVWR